MEAQGRDSRCSTERRQQHMQGAESRESFLEVEQETGNQIQGLRPPLAKLSVTSNTIDS